MNVVKKFSGSTLTAKKATSFDWTLVSDGQIYKAVQGTDFLSSTKGFLVSMSRYANEAGYTVERFVSDDATTVEFRLTQKSLPVESVESVDATPSV